MSVTFRPLAPDDLEDLHEMILRPGVFHGTSRTPYQTRAQMEARLYGPGATHTIVAEAEGRAIGYAALARGSDRRAHSASLAIAVDDRWHGQGVGRGLMDALLDLADNWLGLVRVELETNIDNDTAIRLYTACGFEREGVKRAAVLRAGRYVDSLIMARLRPAPSLLAETGAAQ